MQDQIIDAVMARSIHADAVRTHPLAAWVIVRDQIDYPGDLVARLVTDQLRCLQDYTVRRNPRRALPVGRREPAQIRLVLV